MKLTIIQALLLYSKGHLVEYDRRSVEHDLAVMFGELHLLTPEYFLASKRGKEDMLRLLLDALYDFRKGQFTKQEFHEIALAHMHWLGDNTIEKILGMFGNCAIYDEAGTIVVEMPAKELGAELGEKILQARSARGIAADSEEDAGPQKKTALPCYTDITSPANQGPYLSNASAQG